MNETNKQANKKALYFVALGNPAVMYLHQFMFLIISLSLIALGSAINTINIQMLNHCPCSHLNTHLFALDVSIKSFFRYLADRRDTYKAEAN